MRKRFKKKKHSCALCKPHKMCWAHRWKKKDLDLLKLAEKEFNALRGAQIQHEMSVEDYDLHSLWRGGFYE